MRLRVNEVGSVQEKTEVPDVGKERRRISLLDNIGQLRKTSKQSMSKYKQVLTCKDFKGFKKIKNIEDRYRLGRILGEGSFSTVKVGLHKPADLMCAVKIIDK